MYYALDGTYAALSKKPDGPLLELLTTDEAKQAGLPSLHLSHFCKVEEEEDRLCGCFRIPEPGTQQKSETLSFTLTGDRLTLVDDREIARGLFRRLRPYHGALTPSAVFCLLFEALIGGDLPRLEELENRNSRLESAVLSGTLENFDHKMMALRKEILMLSHYYAQLMEMNDLLLENTLVLFSKQELQLLRQTGRRIGRLWEESRMLREYSMQIREAYQAQISIRQNKIMKILTIVTTIFLPLSLVVGWYGMNFKFMPELSWKLGYPAVILFCAAIVAVCIYWFRKKRFW